MPEIIKAVDSTDLAKKAADVFIETVRTQKNPLITLPSGFTPQPFYKELVRRYDGGERDLGDFTYLALDEYAGLPNDDHRLFARWLDKEILGPLSIPHESRIVFQSDAPDPDLEMQRVEDLINEHASIDLAVAGLGTNGHIGFNEPDSDFDAGVRLVTLDESTRHANALYWGGDLDQVPRTAYTLGLGILKKARRTLLLVSGESKAAILKQALTGPVTTDVPASYLQQQGNVTIIADEAALSLF